MIGCLCAALNTLQILPDQSKRRLHVPHSPSRCSPSVNMICKIYKFIQRRRRPGLKPEPRRRPRLRSGPHVCFINTSLEPGYDSRAPCTRIPCYPLLPGMCTTPWEVVTSHLDLPLAWVETLNCSLTSDL